MQYIPLTRGQFAIVDDADYEWLSQWKWFAKKGGHSFYACRLATNIFMHRILMGLTKEDKRQIDHVNGNGLDNRRINLRICTVAQNQWNSNSNKGKSRYKGVYWYKRHRVWIAQIGLNYKRIHIGRFKSEKDAALAYDQKAKELFGEYAKTNF